MRSEPGSAPSTAERVTLVLSFLVVAVLIGAALVEEARIEGSEPAGLEVTFDVGLTTVHEGNYFVPYTVLNHGGQAIDSAQFRIEVLSGESVVQADDLSIQFLPLDGVQTGLFVTQFDPATHTLRATPLTLQFP
jgi:uncharacterized protein (TIGR02588 family)